MKAGRAKARNSRGGEVAWALNRERRYGSRTAMGCGQGGGESGRVGDAPREPTESNVGGRIDVWKGYVAGLKILGDGRLAWQLQKF